MCRLATKGKHERRVRCQDRFRGRDEWRTGWCTASYTNSVKELSDVLSHAQKGSTVPVPMGPASATRLSLLSGVPTSQNIRDFGNAQVERVHATGRLKLREKQEKALF